MRGEPRLGHYEWNTRRSDAAGFRRHGHAAALAAQGSAQKACCPAAVARVVLDVQATHLGQPFDYFVDDSMSEAAQPGVLVRVRFGGQRVSGIIWERVNDSDTPTNAIRYIEKVVSPRVLVPSQMRRDITAVANAYGGTIANVLRVAMPGRGRRRGEGAQCHHAIGKRRGVGCR